MPTGSVYYEAALTAWLKLTDLSSSTLLSAVAPRRAPQYRKACVTSAALGSLSTAVLRAALTSIIGEALAWPGAGVSEDQNTSGELSSLSRPVPQDCPATSTVPTMGLAAIASQSQPSVLPITRKSPRWSTC